MTHLHLKFTEVNTTERSTVYSDVDNVEPTTEHINWSVTDCNILTKLMFSVCCVIFEFYYGNHKHFPYRFIASFNIHTL